MALLSMTGYGRGASTGRGVKVAVELSSVNRKQFDVRISLPKSLVAVESRLVEAIHAAVSRGQVTGGVTVSASEAARHQGVRVDAALAAAYVRELRRLATTLHLKDDLSASLLPQLPEVLQYRHVEEDVSRMWPVCQRALDAALAELLAMRRREGRALERDLARRFRQLSAWERRLRSLTPAVTERYRQTLQARLEKAGFAAGSEDPMVMKELALFAERSDIAEEITRLDSHLKQAVTLLQRKEPVGRTLDFLVQEMFREVNTIASKANDVVIVKVVIDFKTELERIREQVQNVE